MKKYLFLMLTAFAVASCNDECDHGFGGDESISGILVGSWYEETQNEEDTYSASGSFYGKFCNTVVQGEGNGRYFIDSEKNRLTWSYNVNGSSQMSDWKLTNVTDLGFTMSSDIAILKYGKIVETFNMEGGDTKQITFNKETVLGYKSNNSNIATVSSDGLIKATGEKGTAYIKIILNKGNVWAKVVVGDETPDLWIDYSFLLGCDFVAMKDTLGVQSQSQDFGDYTSYSYIISTHNILDYINVFVDNNSHLITQIDMHVREGVTQEEILAYMNSHYYKIEGNFGKQYHYSTSSTLEKSRAVYVYDTENKTVLLMSKDMYYPSEWPDFLNTFGLTKEQVKFEMDKRGYKFYQSFDSYSAHGSDAYIIDDEDYNIPYAVEFVFNPDNIVSQYWIYLQYNDEAQYNYLATYYNFAENEYVDGSNVFPFYNADRTLKIEINLEKKAICYTDLTKKQHIPPLLDNYWKGLGMNHDEIVATFGEPLVDEGGAVGYYCGGEHVNVCVFFIDNTTNKCKEVRLALNENEDPATIIDFLNSMYNVFEQLTEKDGSQYAWINGLSISDASMGIVYIPSLQYVIYQSLGSTSNSSAKVESMIQASKNILPLNLKK